MISPWQQRIRPLAICLFSHGDRILAAVGEDPAKGQTFYRPLGGAIEFGETAAQTIMREIQEELGAAVTGLRYLGTLENIFTFNGQPGHEIVMVFDGMFMDRLLYNEPELTGHEHEINEEFRAVWLSRDDLRRPDAPPLYPDGLLAMLGW